VIMDAFIPRCSVGLKTTAPVMAAAAAIEPERYKDWQPAPDGWTGRLWDVAP
jgi:hypothetical protein